MFDVVSVVLLLTTCAFFAAIVFMPLFLQIVTGASATESGLLLLPLLLAATTTHRDRRPRHLTHRPLQGLPGRRPRADERRAVPALAVGRDHVAGDASLFMVVFGLGFGMVSQVLVLAIQNAVDRRDIGIATASANLFRVARRLGRRRPLRGDLRQPPRDLAAAGAPGGGTEN